MNSKAIRGKKWRHPQTVTFLETILDNIENQIVAKGRQESKLQFFAMDAFNAIKDGGRTPEQMNTRLENLLKDYRKVRFLFVSYIAVFFLQ